MKGSVLNHSARRQRRLTNVLSSVFALLALHSTAWAASYTFTTLSFFAEGNQQYWADCGVRGLETSYGVFYDQDHGMSTDFRVPGSNDTAAYGINNLSQIVGNYDQSTHGFVESNGSFTTIDVPGKNGSHAQGINDAGSVVGTYGDSAGAHGFLYSGGQFTTFDVPGGRNMDVSGINNQGDIVGSFIGNGRASGFLYQKGVFATLDAPGSIGTSAYGVNNLGEIVGSYTDSLKRGHGFLYEDGVFTTFDAPGNSGTIPHGINDLGQIVGLGAGNSFLATPVPEPASFALFAAGLIGGLLLWRKRTQ